MVFNTIMMAVVIGLTGGSLSHAAVDTSKMTPPPRPSTPAPELPQKESSKKSKVSFSDVTSLVGHIAPVVTQGIQTFGPQTPQQQSRSSSDEDEEENESEEMSAGIGEAAWATFSKAKQLIAIKKDPNLTSNYIMRKFSNTNVVTLAGTVYDLSPRTTTAEAINDRYLSLLKKYSVAIDKNPDVMEIIQAGYDILNAYVENKVSR